MEHRCNDFDWGNKYSENICQSGQGLKLDLVGEGPAANGPSHARPSLCNNQVHTAVGFISRASDNMSCQASFFLGGGVGGSVIRRFVLKFCQIQKV